MGSVFEYTFLLWWNSFWTIAPVIAIGLFDRIVGMWSSPCNSCVEIHANPPDDDILMALPELYRYGREGYWFSMKLFLAYMLDGVMQVRSKTYPLSILPVLTLFTVGDHLLPHLVRLLCTHFPIGWLRRLSIRVFHRHGYFRRLRGQFLQRVGN